MHSVRLRHCAIAAVLAMTLCIGSTHADPIDLGIGGALTAGDSLVGESLGDIGLEIASTAPGGNVRLIEELGADRAYGAPNYGSVGANPDGSAHGSSGFPGNGCIDGLGFADLATAQSNGKPGFRFSFDVAVRAFGLRMLDFGDFNPTRATEHEVIMRAYDGMGALVDSQTLYYTSDGQVNPRQATIVGDMVDPIYAGDACWAPDYAALTGLATTGVYHWNVTDGGTSGIRVVDLEFTVGWDPKIGFDSLEYEEIPRGCEVDLCAGQHTPVGTVGVVPTASGICVTYETFDGWGMTEIHLEIVGDTNAFPVTKSGSPKIGQFSTQASYAPPITTEEFCFTWEELGLEPGDAVYIAAHAVVVNGDQEETAWGDGCEGAGFGGRSWATYFSCSDGE